MILLGLVGLAAPAATAGAICLDKARGNLALLLRHRPVRRRDRAGEARGAAGAGARDDPLRGPGAGDRDALRRHRPGRRSSGPCSWSLSCAVFGCALALTLSVWGRKTHEVLMATYVLGILYLLTAPIYAGLQAMLPAAWRAPWLPSFWGMLRYNPIFLVLAAFGGSPPGLVPIGGVRRRFLGMGLAASAGLIGAATWRVRAVVIRQLGRESERRGAGRGPRGRFADRPRSARSPLPGAGPVLPPGVPGVAEAVAGPQPGALARVPAEAPVALGPRGLGNLCLALRGRSASTRSPRCSPAPTGVARSAPSSTASRWGPGCCCSAPRPRRAWPRSASGAASTC